MACEKFATGQKIYDMPSTCLKMYLCWQGKATKGMTGVAWQMGHAVLSSAELDDLSFEKGRRRFLIDDELRRGRSNNNISCHQNQA